MKITSKLWKLKNFSGLWKTKQQLSANANWTILSSHKFAILAKQIIFCIFTYFFILFLLNVIELIRGNYIKDVKIFFKLYFKNCWYTLIFPSLKWGLYPKLSINDIGNFRVSQLTNYKNCIRLISIKVNIIYKNFRKNISLNASLASWKLNSYCLKRMCSFKNILHYIINIFFLENNKISII